MGFSGFSVLWLRKPIVPCPMPVLQVSFLEKKVTELEKDSLTSGGLKSKLKQENTQLVHRSGAGASGERGAAPVSLFHRGGRGLSALSHLA